MALPFAHALLASGAVNIDLNWTMVAHLVMFTAFCVVMKDMVFDPLLRVFEERERRTQGAIDQARAMDEQAIALKQELDEKMDGIRREAAGDRERIRAHLAKLEAEMMEAARAKALEKLERGLATIDEQAAEIRADLEAQRASLAAEIAGKVLGRELPAKTTGARG